ncbi:MAG: CoA pyrophosphatase, partial [Acidobacteria bacterium]|nr:CoA pyrophosphatase [Acidobacteriota bacterium]
MDARKDLLELVQRTQSGHVDSNFSDARVRGILDSATARKAAVLLLFGRLDAQPAASHLPLVPTDLDVLLVERASSLNDHPGQVAFPGGGV